MKEKKFRGKSKKDNNWIYGYLVIFNNRTFIVIPESLVTIHDTSYDNKDVEKISFRGYSVEVIPKTIGQFIKKCNNKEIYEGDMFRDCEGELYVVEYNETNTIFIVKSLNDNSTYNINMICDKYIQPIGNIHDNPKLLKN